MAKKNQTCAGCRAAIRQGFPENGLLFCTLSCLHDYDPVKRRSIHTRTR